MSTDNQSAQSALAALLRYAEARECTHETTYRGGAIWTICHECGKKWADDEGGFKPYQEPPEIANARSALAQAPAPSGEPMTLGQQVAHAREALSRLTPEQRASIVLEGQSTAKGASK